MGGREVNLNLDNVFKYTVLFLEYPLQSVVYSSCNDSAIIFSLLFSVGCYLLPTLEIIFDHENSLKVKKLFFKLDSKLNMKVIYTPLTFSTIRSF